MKKYQQLYSNAHVPQDSQKNKFRHFLDHKCFHCRHKWILIVSQKYSNPRIRFRLLINDLHSSFCFGPLFGTNFVTCCNYRLSFDFNQIQNYRQNKVFSILLAPIWRLNANKNIRSCCCFRSPFYSFYF